MHIQNADCSAPDITEKIKKCISSKEQISCIGPHAIFKVIEALNENVFFTTKFQNFDQMSGVVFYFVTHEVNNTNDFITMKTSTNTNVKSLATAIHKTTLNDKEIRLSCIGKSSINQAVKAIAIFFKDPQSYAVHVEKKKIDDSAESREIVSFLIVKVN